ncbi:MAG TPA: outer membrane beta-barrel protein [Kofleriaceae bacterium]|jgi:hypothetical protein|nr:outer membrane beta-barrel protein [Kofleriaceae bacterium]
MTTMKRAILVGSVLLATTGAASAGTYVGLGVGPEANVSDIQWTSSGSRSARLLGGYGFNGLRVGTLAVEASLTGQSLTYANPNARGLLDAMELGLAAKYSYPLGDGFEVFGKLGAHHSWLSHEREGASTHNTSGTGVLLGVGAEFRFKLGPTRGVSVFVDYTHYRATFEGDYFMNEGAGIGMWMLGFTVGL